jgi:hypothetical protein
MSSTTALSQPVSDGVTTGWRFASSPPDRLLKKSVCGVALRYHGRLTVSAALVP